MVEERVTLAEAIHNWLEVSKNGGTVRYQDSCSGPHCNDQCPETVMLGQTKPYWKSYIQAFIVIIVVAVSFICAAIKLVLYLCEKYLSYQQLKFMEWKYYGHCEYSESAVRMHA